AAQRDLPRHRDVGTRGPPGKERRQRRHHRDPGRGAVLRHPAGRHVDVHVRALEGRLVDGELRPVRAPPRAPPPAPLPPHHLPRPSPCLWGTGTTPPPAPYFFPTRRLPPPAGVHASPPATPGCPVRSAISGSNLTGPSSSGRSAAPMRTGPSTPSSATRRATF